MTDVDPAESRLAEDQLLDELEWGPGCYLPLAEFDGSRVCDVHFGIALRGELWCDLANDKPKPEE